MATSRKSPEDGETAAEPLQAEIAALRADLAELGAMVGRLGKEHAANLKAAASATVAGGYAKGGAALHDVAAELRDLEEEIADATRDNPWRALGIAAVVGFVLGFILRR